MNTTMKYLTAILVLFIMSLQPAEAQSRMNRFFAYNDCDAYWWVSKLAHPTNEFKSGYCEDYGDYVDITVCSKKHTTKIRFYKSDTRFYNLEVVSDTDWFDAFEACNLMKDTAIDYLRDKNSDTIRDIENIFGSLNRLSCRQMCLAMLTYKLWRYPY